MEISCSIVSLGVGIMDLQISVCFDEFFVEEQTIF